LIFAARIFDWGIWEIWVFGDEVDDIASIRPLNQNKISEHLGNSPETVNTFFKPKPNNIVDSFSHLGIFPVEVWLLWGKQVEVVLLTFFHPDPSTSCNMSGSGSKSEAL
jgi:hypothetical protein